MTESHVSDIQLNKNKGVTKMSEADLSFDEEIVCTELAKEYLNNVTKFSSMGLIDSSEHEYDEFKNKIFYTQSPFRVTDDGQTNTTSKTYDLLELVEKINKNSDLFCQLEFLIRKIPVRDTKNVDLKLISLNLLRQYNVLINEKRELTYINIGDDTPLFHLGLFACKRNDDVVTICCTKMTVAVCSLFVQLCKDAGFGGKVQLAITKNLFPPPISALPRWDAGCVGVVSATSDVDSAVETFLSATTRYPWKLKKIFVQEPAIERFRQVMKWKQDLHSPGRVDARLRDSCTAAFNLRGQIFLDEYVGTESFDGCQNVVSIDVFRTVKEVISLVNATNPFALSVWSSDVAESNEIATEVDAGVVWINGHGCFDGPPLGSAPVYDTDVSTSDRNAQNDIVSEQGNSKIIKAWLKLEPSQRMLKIHEAFARWRKHSSFKNFEEIPFGCDAIVDVQRQICIVTRKCIHAAIVHHHDIYAFYPRYLKYIAEGGVIILFSSNQQSIRNFLSEVGAPIFISSSNDCRQTKMYTTKVIWTSVGTVFSN